MSWTRFLTIAALLWVLWVSAALYVARVRQLPAPEMVPAQMVTCTITHQRSPFELPPEKRRWGRLSRDGGVA